MADPTYRREEIDRNPAWRLAFVLSEIMNDGAPIGWGKYILAAECLLASFDVRPRDTTSPPPSESGERAPALSDCPDCGEFMGHGHVCAPSSGDANKGEG